MAPFSVILSKHFILVSYMELALASEAAPAGDAMGDSSRGCGAWGLSLIIPKPTTKRHSQIAICR